MRTDRKNSLNLRTVCTTST